MQCRNCSTPLTLQDLTNNEWSDVVEEFIFVCPVCKTEKRLVTFLFDSGHITDQYLELFILDSEYFRKEKFLDYMPEQQRNFLISHLSSCSSCSDRLESMRLSKVCQKVKIDETMFRFFSKQAVSVFKELKQSEVVFRDSKKIKAFLFEGVVYHLSEEKKFYEDNELLCYSLEKQKHDIGMVSFFRTKENVIVEKIWFKSKERIQKEKNFLSSLKNTEMKILIDLVKKKDDFL